MTVTNAQTITDGLRYASTSNYGTARFQAMSGAFGALGGDLSAISINPASSAVYLNASSSFSIGIQDTENRFRFQDNNSSSFDTDANINQLGGVFVINTTDETSPWKKFTIALNYQVESNYSTQVFISGTNQNSIATFFKDQAGGISLDLLEPQGSETIADLYSFLGQSQGTAAQNALLGYQSYIISPLDPLDPNNTSYISSIGSGPVNQKYLKTTTGNNSKGTINLGAQYTDHLYFGGNLNSHNIFYRESTYLKETNNNTASTITEIGFQNNLFVYGTGFSAQLGTIATYNNLRVGIAIDTPTWYQINEETSQSIQTIGQENSNIININPNVLNVFEQYRLRTPGKVTGSAAYIFGESGLISIDYSYKNYASIDFSTNTSSNVFQQLNTSINNRLQAASAIKVGGEYRIKNISLRAGLQFEESPYNDSQIARDTHGFSFGGAYSLGSYTIDLAYSRVSQDTNQQQVFGLSQTYTNAIDTNRAVLTFVFNF
tara:strand:- start:133 stop:1605 length:1473 start_codon:yes stop_codon:yes gene_type:complete